MNFDNFLVFNEAYSNFICNLQKQNKYQEILQHFKNTNDFNLMAKKLWEIPEIHKIIKEFYFNSSNVSHTIEKNDKRALEFKEQGNKLFKNRKFMLALDSYNNGISVAPQKSFNVSDLECLFDFKNSDFYVKKFDFETLATLYANRSAACFELSAFEECSEDIARAIFYGYPIEKKHQIIVRKYKCFIALREKARANNVLKSYLKIFGDNLDDGVRAQLKLFLKNGTSAILPDPSLKNYQFVVSAALIPMTPNLEKCNSKFPALSDAVNIAYSEEKGRHMVAKRDIFPGEVIAKEAAFKLVVYPAKRRLMCFHCGDSSKLRPIPCPFCAIMMYCSEKCLGEAYKNYHKYECAISGSVYGIDGSGMESQGFLYLVFRVLREIPFSVLKKEVKILEKEEKNHPSRHGFDYKGIYKTDYRSIFHLKTNKEKMSSANLLYCTAKAICLVHFFVKSGYLGAKDVDKLCKSDMILLASVSLRHSLSLPINSSGENQEGNDVCFFHATCMRIVTMNLLNHSCFSNTAGFTKLDYLLRYCVSFMAKGEELTDRHLPDFCYLDRDIRRANLQRYHGFICECDACRGNWPLYRQLSDRINFECSNCLMSTVPYDGKKCTNCDEPVLKLQAVSLRGKSDYKDVLEMKKKYLELFSCKQSVKPSFVDVLNGSLKHLTDLLTFLGKYTKVPTKVWIDAREELIINLNLRQS